MGKTWQASWMNPDHSEFQDATRKFFAAELVPNIEAWADQGVVDREFWRKAGKMDLLGH